MSTGELLTPQQQRGKPNGSTLQAFRNNQLVKVWPEFRVRGKIATEKSQFRKNLFIALKMRSAQFIIVLSVKWGSGYLVVVRLLASWTDGILPSKRCRNNKLNFMLFSQFIFCVTACPSVCLCSSSLVSRTDPINLTEISASYWLSVFVRGRNGMDYDQGADLKSILFTGLFSCSSRSWWWAMGISLFYTWKTKRGDKMPH